MEDPGKIRRRKRLCNRAVLGGLCLMALALLVSAQQLAPPLATTVAAIVGFVAVAYGVNVGWALFYDREPDGPPS